MEGQVARSAMLGYEEFTAKLDLLKLHEVPVIAHAALKPFGHIEGWTTAVLQALFDTTGGLMMPTFTYKTMVTPEVGPANNGIAYGSDRDLNRMAEPFHPDMSADPLMGSLAEALRQNPYAHRTSHPILSFTGENVDAALDSQTLYDPLAPIGVLADQDGWVLLMGVDQTVNTSIHYAEKLAGRKQFVRWAHMPNRIVECRGFPGCSDGFNDLATDLQSYTHRVEVGNSFIDALPLQRLIEVVTRRIKANSLDLLCQRGDCERCNAVRVSVG